MEKSQANVMGPSPPVTCTSLFTLILIFQPKELSAKSMFMLLSNVYSFLKLPILLVRLPSLLHWLVNPGLDDSWSLSQIGLPSVLCPSMILISCSCSCSTSSFSSSSEDSESSTSVNPSLQETSLIYASVSAINLLSLMFSCLCTVSSKFTFIFLVLAPRRQKRAFILRFSFW